MHRRAAHASCKLRDQGRRDAPPPDLAADASSRSDHQHLRQRIPTLLPDSSGNVPGATSTGTSGLPGAAAKPSSPARAWPSNSNPCGPQMRTSGASSIPGDKAESPMYAADGAWGGIEAQPAATQQGATLRGADSVDDAELGVIAAGSSLDGGKQEHKAWDAGEDLPRCIILFPTSVCTVTPSGSCNIFIFAGEITELPRWWEGVEYRYRVQSGAATVTSGVMNRPPSSALTGGGRPPGRSSVSLAQGLLSQPSVRLRKTIATTNEEGDVIAVNAQK